ASVSLAPATPPPTLPDLCKRMKGRAPSPPQAPQPAQRSIFRTPVQEGGNAGTDAKENILRPRVHLQVTVPQGYQTSLTEDGSHPSKALMDLLVELCSHFHLNPAVHTLELFSPEGDPLAFKPNALLGSLNVARVLIKEKVLEEKVMRRPAPKIPEKTVRLMVNYHGSQKAVVRVNPFVPLRTLLPAICEKCDFDPAHVLLLKDSISRHELQLDKSLTDLEIKELYVHDQSLVLQPKMASAPALNYSDSICSSTSSLSRTEKKSFLGIFHFSRRKSKKGCSFPISPTVRYSNLGPNESVMNIPRTSPTAQLKKRRAPSLPGAP
uniref:Cordon-bleu WH2 repeat protein n=1 Tax=Tetraodon nigroviridis TaxID=99883 RepID=H3DP68_TETNG